MHCQASSITVNVQIMHLQNGGSGFGIYAIAYATTYAMINTQKVFDTTKIDLDLTTFSAWSPKRCSHFHVNVVTQENLKLKMSVSIARVVF